VSERVSEEGREREKENKKEGVSEREREGYIRIHIERERLFVVHHFIKHFI
jgi:hypothetical protein